MTPERAARLREIIENNRPPTPGYGFVGCVNVLDEMDSPEGKKRRYAECLLNISKCGGFAIERETHRCQYSRGEITAWCDLCPSGEIDAIHRKAMRKATANDALAWYRARALDAYAMHGGYGPEAMSEAA